MGGRRRTSAAAAGPVLLAALVLPACGSGDQQRAEAAELDGPRRPLVVDTDLAADDLVALAFLLSSPQVDVRAVTVSGTGEVRCPAGLEVVAGLLALTGDEDVPVACGRTTPLEGDHAFPAEWRDLSDRAWGVALPDGRASAPHGTTAVELLVDTLDRRTTLLTLGPLTNVAETFREDPRLATEVRSVVVMGGAVGVGGNVFDGQESPTAEWNMYVDPTAAAEVLASGAPVTLVGLDATNQAPITGDFVEAVRGVADSDTGSDTARLVGDLLAANPMVASGEAFFWDPLAAAVVVDPSLVETEQRQLVVVTEEEDSGRTLEEAGGATVTVAVDADPEALEELLLATLS